jgi:hypothetical protein
MICRSSNGVKAKSLVRSVMATIIFVVVRFHKFHYPRITHTSIAHCYLMLLVYCCFPRGRLAVKVSLLCRRIITVRTMSVVISSGNWDYLSLHVQAGLTILDWSN